MRRFLQAGVMEDGAFTASDEGARQGGLVSPSLSRIDLHDVLDLWFEKRVAGSCAGGAFLIRCADDDVACFEHATDARAFLTARSERLAQFDLEIEPSKTALLPFGSHCLGSAARKDGDGPRAFSVLGVTPDGKRVRRELKLIGERLSGLRAHGGAAMVTYLIRHLSGHMQNEGVSGKTAGAWRGLSTSPPHCCSNGSIVAFSGAR